VIATEVGRRRPRQARSVANDAAIQDATVSLLDEAGWEACAPGRIAESAGLSRSAVLERYGDRTGAVVSAWTERLAPVARQALGEVLHAVGAPGSVTEPRSLLAGLRPFFSPDESMRAVAEVLLVARYVEPLADAVAASLGTDLDAWLTPLGSRLSKEQAARHAMTVIVAVGMLVEARTGHRIASNDLQGEVEAFSRALDAEVTAVKLPATRAMHLAVRPVLEDADPALLNLLTATLAEVGERGYEAATVTRIARASGYTKGLLFGRYANKRELFLDATNRGLAGAAQANEAFQQRVAATTTPGIADAVITRETMRPELKSMRTITTEQFRLAWHDEDMRATFSALQDTLTRDYRAAAPHLTTGQARGHIFFELARGIGMGIVADLHPTAWKLPYDIVLVPFIDG
jgi:AcrR family transcriptional regulator